MQSPTAEDPRSGEEPKGIGDPGGVDPRPVPQGKPKWGRERPPGAPGHRLVGRLGPPLPELAEFHNQPLAEGLQAAPGDDGHQPRVPLDTDLDSIWFVSLDCETTGHFPDRMVELGAVRFRLPRDGEVEPPRRLLETLVHTVDHINPYAHRVHGISRSMLTGAPSLRRVAQAFREFARGAILVEHSADAFDTRLVSKAMDRPLPRHHLDTSRIAGYLFELRDTIGLERLCERLEVTHRQAHFALADAEATADCFVRLVRLGRQEKGWSTLGDLVEVGMPPGRREAEAPLHHEGGAVRSPAAAAPSRPPRRHRGGRRHRPSGSPAAIPGGGSPAVQPAS